jgi:F-type H+-transporting ATPase subunit b
VERRTQRMRFALLAAAASAGPAFAAEAGEPSIFSGDIGNFIFTLIIFVIVVTVLGKFAWKPVLRVLQQREQMIHDALVEAKRERAEADKLLARYQQQVDHAREEATAIVEEGKRDAEAVRRRLHEEAQREAGEMIERAKREIRLATDAAVKDVYDLAGRLAVEVAGQVLQAEVSPDKHRQLVQDALGRISAADNARRN